MPVSGQKLTEIINDESLSYLEKVGLIENNGDPSKVLDKAEEGAVKRYYRWRAFWDTRIDRNGSNESFLQEWQNISPLLVFSPTSGF